MSSTATHIGLVPRLLPVTGTFLLPFAIVNTALSWNVVRNRIQGRAYLGEKSNNPSFPDTDSSKSPVDPLFVAIRTHANFLENVPLALLFGAIIELNGGNRKVLTGALAGFLAIRLSHLTGMFIADASSSIFRPIGYFGSLGSIVGLGAWAGYLSLGYWNL